MTRKPTAKSKLIALAFIAAVLVTGLLLLGTVPTILFAIGYLGGMALWLARPTHASFADIRAPYFLTLALFICHKLEEKYQGFFPALAELTGVAIPTDRTPLALLLYVLASAWLLIPFLMKRGHALGHFLACTFFVSMGVTELAHFLFPFFTGKPYAYFPGMWSVVPLAPAAWWGIQRLAMRETMVLASWD